MLHPPASATARLPMASLVERLGRSERWPAWRRLPTLSRATLQRQVVQIALDSVEVRMALERDLNAAESERLCRSLRERLAWPHALHLRRVEHIRPPGSHKLEDFVSLVDSAA